MTTCKSKEWITEYCNTRSRYLALIISNVSSSIWLFTRRFWHFRVYTSLSYQHIIRYYTLIISARHQLKWGEHKPVPVVIVRKRSWPAVSQIWSLILFPSSSIVLILKSILYNQNAIKIRPEKEAKFEKKNNSKFNCLYISITTQWW